LPQRPGYGTRGKPITLFANYFQLITQSGLELYRYGIEITPVGSARQPVGKKVKRLIQLLIEEHFTADANSIASDYKSNLVSMVRLPLDEDHYVVRYRSEDEDESSPNADSYKLHVQATGTLMVSELTDHLTSTQASGLLGSKGETIQALNIVLGHHPKTVRDIVSVGANKHFEISEARRETMSLGAGLQAIRGFFVSVRAATARVLINVQVKHGAFYMEGPLERLMDAYVAQNGRDMFKLAKFVSKVRVRVTHIKRKNKAGKDIPRIKTIAGLAMPSDGRDLQHPPIVSRFAAGSKDVKFFNGTIDQPQSPSAIKGKKSKKPIQQGPKPRQDDYISVYDFFRSRKPLLMNTLGIILR
jgi:eukaryotic translation initiation factor 2C